MHIRGTDRPRCELCVHCRIASEGAGFSCRLNENETTAKSSCSNFKYDIFKYKPTDKAKIGSFKKEDFEI